MVDEHFSLNISLKLKLTVLVIMVEGQTPSINKPSLTHLVIMFVDKREIFQDVQKYKT